MNLVMHEGILKLKLVQMFIKASETMCRVQLPLNKSHLWKRQIFISFNWPLFRGLNVHVFAIYHTLLARLFRR